MTNKRIARKTRHRDDSGAGLIMFMMMALVFAPIAALHAAMLWRGSHELEQLAAMMTALLPRF
jgi:hypothetical protein